MTLLIVSLVLWSFLLNFNFGANAICKESGTLEWQQDWYSIGSKLTHQKDITAYFWWNITYRVTDSEENPIQLVLYQENALLNSNMTCDRKLAVAKSASLLFENLTMNGSVCDKHGDKLNCSGEESFDDLPDAVFIAAVVRCGSRSLYLDYNISYDGFSGVCEQLHPIGLSCPAIAAVVVSCVGCVIFTVTLIYLIRRRRSNPRSVPYTVELNFTMDSFHYEDNAY